VVGKNPEISISVLGYDSPFFQRQEFYQLVCQGRKKQKISCTC
jgi:hypothetical protein